MHCTYLHSRELEAKPAELDRIAVARDEEAATKRQLIAPQQAELAAEEEMAIASVKANSQDPAAIVSLMRAHASSPAVQEHGCRALCSIAMLAENKEKVVAAGGIIAVVAAMRAHPSSPAVQEQGCWALCSIAALIENQAKVAAEGGIDAAVAAMRANASSSPAMQELGYRELANIALLAVNKAKAAAAGGIDVAVAAMRARAGSPFAVQDDTIASSDGGTLLQDQVRAAGAEQLARAAMAAQAGGTEVKRLAGVLVGKINK